MMQRKTWAAALGVLIATASAAQAQSANAPSPAAPRPAAGPSASEVTVTAARPGVTTSIDSRAYLLDRDLGAATGTLAEALRNVPSVDVDIDGNISLRGDQSVQILVDGKPSPMFTGPGRAQALLSFPAKDIERVEVMTTPSAAYSPEGSGGIINIITKNPNRGMTTASVTAQYGSAGGTRFSGNYTRRAGKLTITASANRNEEPQTQNNTIFRSARSSPTATPLDSDARYWVSIANVSQFANLNLTYDATPKWQFGVSANGGNVDVAGTALIHLETFRAGVPVSLTDTFLTTPIIGFNISGYGASATRKFDGQEHDLSMNYNFSRNAQFQVIENTIVQTLPPGPQRAEVNFTGSVTRQSKVRVNYRRPLPGAGKLAFGYEWQDDDNSYDTFFSRGPSIPSVIVDPTISGAYPFAQRINSFFGTVERPLGKFTPQLGLRFETTDLTIPIAGERSYSHTYPTLNFGYKLSDTSSLRGGYSRRVQRPGPNQLNPFRTQPGGDALIFNEGNPDLQPQETDSLELGYQYRKAQTSYLATLYWRVAHDEFTAVTRDIGGGISIQRPENLGSSRSGGVELVANGRFTMALKYSLSTNTFWKEIDADNLGYAGARSAFGVSGNANLNWDVTAKDALQLNATATGKRLTAQGYSPPSWQLNAGWRHKLNDRIAATLTLRDVLATQGSKNVIDTPLLTQVSTWVPRTNRAAWFQLTYTFGANDKPTDPKFDYGGGGGLGN
jgi:outer membrane receptor protein involved in Fe transport